jgi:hypothetical protein
MNTEAPFVPYVEVLVGSVFDQYTTREEFNTLFAPVADVVGTGLDEPAEWLDTRHGLHLDIKQSLPGLVSGFVLKGKSPASHLLDCALTQLGANLSASNRTLTGRIKILHYHLPDAEPEERSIWYGKPAELEKMHRDNALRSALNILRDAGITGKVTLDCRPDREVGAPPPVFSNEVIVYPDPTKVFF